MIIIDTSVIFKWFDLNEPNRIQALNLLKKHLLKKEEIMVPELLLYELTNAWSTKSRLDLEAIEVNLSTLEKYELTIKPTTFDTMKKVAHFSKQHRVSAYDATYAILAQDKKCELITADNKFVDKVKLPYIKRLKKP